MGIFQRMRDGLIRFMYGRNGMDQLNRAIFWAYLLLWLAGIVISAVLHRSSLAMMVVSFINILMWVLLVLLFFRTFSRDLYKRREENQKWVNWWWGVKGRSASARARHADKEHKYFTCKSCKTICRVPVGKGKIVITCPKCSAKIEGKS